MRRLRIGVLDLVTKTPNPILYGRIMHPNLASIMPQVVAVWCEREGHEVTLVCYTGMENLMEELPTDLDLLFIGAFTQSAQLAYAVSAYYRRRGTVTVLGGPHARCYPEDARPVLRLRPRLHRSGDRGRSAAGGRAPSAGGALLAASRQPAELPTLQERWKFVEATLRKAPTIKIVPMLGSLGCPYTCSFCIDSHGGLPAAQLPQLRGRSGLPAHQDEAPDRRLARPQFRGALRRLHGGGGGGGAAGPDAAHRGEQPVAALRAAPQAAQQERLPGDPAGHRVVVRPGEQVEDPAHRDGQGHPGGRAREPDPAVHPLHPDEFRARPRRRPGARAVRAHQAVPRPRPRARSPPIRCSPRSGARRRSIWSISARAGCGRSRSTS